MAIETLTLERVTICTQKAVSDALADSVKFETERMPHMRATVLTAFLRTFGKSVRFEFKAPATWWQHVKHALKAKWPRLFKRLGVRYRREIVDSGAVLAGIPEEVRSARQFIPYFTRADSGDPPALSLPAVGGAGVDSAVSTEAEAADANRSDARRTQAR